MPMYPLVTCAADWHEFCDVAELYSGRMPTYRVRYIPRNPSSERYWCFDFPNGYTLSVRQFGYGSYSDNDSVELLCWDSNHEQAWDDIRQYQDLDELAAAVKEVSRY